MYCIYLYITCPEIKHSSCFCQAECRKRDFSRCMDDYVTMFRKRGTRKSLVAATSTRLSPGISHFLDINTLYHTWLGPKPLQGQQQDCQHFTVSSYFIYLSVNNVLFPHHKILAQLTCSFRHKLQGSANSYGSKMANKTLPSQQLHSMNDVSRPAFFLLKKRASLLKIYTPILRGRCVLCCVVCVETQ